MKHHICYSLLIAAAISLACQMERSLDNSSGEMTFYASNVAGTRTLLQTDGSVYWSPNDAINIFCNGVHGKFVSTNTTVSDAVEFKGTLEGLEKKGGEYFWAVYPYSETNTFSNGELTVTLPSEQQASPGTFADDLFISVARTTDDHLYFQNVCGGIKFALADEGIRKVVFRGNKNEPVAGTVKVTIENDLPVISEVLSPATEVSLTAPDGSVFTPGQWYYIVCLPGTLSGGYSIDLYGDELIGTKSGSSSVTVRRSVWGTLQGLTPDKHGIYPVDLGLPSGTQWASCNVGASEPFERGDYFAWGETESKRSGDWSNYKWCLGNNRTLTKYCSWAYYGNTDCRSYLEPEDDAAHVLLGEDWWTPTYNEWSELISNTKRTTVDNYQGTGIPGTLFTSEVEGYTDQSIFFPYVVYSIASIGAEGDYAHYRISDRHQFTSRYDYCQQVDPAGVQTFVAPYEVCKPAPIRAIYGRKTVAIEKLYINVERDTEWEDANNTTLMEGMEASLIAIVQTPEDAWPKHDVFTWKSSDPAVATVTDGHVKALSAGTTSITATAENGVSSSPVKVTVLAPVSCVIPQTVDMGTSVKWATFNLGAENVSGKGFLFAWGETEPSEVSDIYYYKYLRAGNGMLKYTPLANGASGDLTDGLNILLPEDDAATVKLGDKWRMPLAVEWKELIDNCNLEYETVNGVNGLLLTSIITGNQLFLPNDKYYWSKTLIDESVGYYEDSSPNSSDALRFRPETLAFEYGSYLDPSPRWNAYYVRPVLDDVSGEQIPIDEEHFPDAVFRDYVSAFDINADQKLGPNERKVSEIKVASKEITSLKGIEYFPALSVLSCSDNQLTELDVSQNTSLTELRCNGNKLTALNVTQNTALTYLACNGNKLTELDLSQNTELRTLMCAVNNFSSLDLSQNIHLQTLNCRVQSLDISKNVELMSLTCTSAGLTTLDLSHNVQLKKLVCNDNQLVQLDLSHNTALEGVNCKNNNLTSLIVRSVSVLDCSNNALTALDLSETSGLTELGCSNNQLVDLNIATQSLLRVLVCNSNQLTELDLSGCPSLEQLACFDNRLARMDLTGCVALLQLSCHTNELENLVIPSPVLTHLVCYGNRLTDLAFNKSRLVQLHCSNNRLLSLDVSSVSSMVELDCHDNLLTSLSMENNPSLKNAYCYGNQLSSLNLSGCSALTEFVAKDNQLTEITFTGCSALMICSLKNNLLTSVDLTPATKLLSLDCSENPLETLYLSTRVQENSYSLFLTAPDGTEVIYQ